MDPSSFLNLIEIFQSVQGETSYAGLPTTFIRLAACNLRCSWCDTTYSFGRGEPVSLDTILTKVREFGCPYICITGGEPLLQKNVYPLMQTLCDLGFHLSLETGGSLSIADVDPRVKIILDVKCPGSQMDHKNLWSNLDLIRPTDEIKFVLANHIDYTWMKTVCEKHQLFKHPFSVLLSPVYDILDPKELVQWMLQDQLPVRLNLQIHKFIWSPQTKGV